MSFESRGTYTECLFHESYRSGDIICHSQGLRVCVCGGGHWRWMHESFYLLYVFGQEWTWISRWSGCSFTTSHHCTAVFLFMPKKDIWLLKKFILHIQIHLIPSVFFLSDAVASWAITLVPREKKTPPKVIRIEGRFNDFIKLISLQPQWVLLDLWTRGFVMIKGLISCNSKEIKLEGLSVLICCKLHFLRTQCVFVCVCTNYTNHNFD